MKNIFQSKPFWLGFVLGIVIFTILNYANYLHNVCPDTIDDCGWSFGFPVHFYSEGGFFTFSTIIWVGLIIDIISASISSLLFGLVFKHVWSNREL